MEANKERKEQEKMELPMESSPYTRCENLEDYKMAGYGAQGHQSPIDRPHHGGATDAPTLSGNTSSATGGRAPAVDSVSRQGAQQ